METPTHKVPTFNVSRNVPYGTHMDLYAPRHCPQRRFVPRSCDSSVDHHRIHLHLWEAFSHGKPPTNSWAILPPNCPHINIKATPITSTFKFRHSNFWDAFWDLEVPKLNCYYFFWIYFGITKGHQKDSCPRNKAKASSHWLELAHAFVTWSGRISQDLIGIRCMWLRYPIGTYTRVI